MRLSPTSSLHLATWELVCRASEDLELEAFSLVLDKGFRSLRIDVSLRFLRPDSPVTPALLEDFRYDLLEGMNEIYGRVDLNIKVTYDHRCD